jgi:hypothetical protein
LLSELTLTIPATTLKPAFHRLSSQNTKIVKVASLIAILVLMSAELQQQTPPGSGLALADSGKLPVLSSKIIKEAYQLLAFITLKYPHVEEFGSRALVLIKFIVTSY